ncbi:MULTISPECIES: aldo/keto reductase [Lysinibacillus]|uniref:aldo/keto reductase n=1 Tax=Lysinibacillus TaxID=400634 RepID=UPI001C309119|nr:aldo/keto reductase [Lysinibacillus sp. GbtcB16]
MDIVLGTAQFGMKYGVTNKVGQTPKDEITKILSYIKSKGFNQIDTAPAYGDAESILGECDLNGLEIISKTLQCPNEIITEKDIEDIQESVDISLENLGKEKLHGILIHNIADCYKTGANKIFEVLYKLKGENKVEKIGVSVYELQDIEMLLENNYYVDIIQLPLNILDQRIYKSGILKRLKEKNIEIYVRSIFLQGILLADENSIENPEITKRVQPYFRELEKNNLTKLEGAIYFISRIPEIDHLVLGVNNLKQLIEIYQVFNKVEKLPCNLMDFSEFAVNEEQLIDPRRW